MSRNYYRCSSSKGCAARKQVERSNSDPNMFIVTYTGDHTHPRPTHRNSLAGSSRSKFAAQKATEKDSNVSDQSLTNMANPACSSPPSATSQLSPTTPPTSVQANDVDDTSPTTTKLVQQEDQNLNLLSGGDEKESEEMEQVGCENEEEDDDILIPNVSMSEDIFMGLQELGCNSPVSASTGAAAAAAVDHHDHHDHQSPSSENFSDQVPTSLGSYWAASINPAAVGGGF